MQRRGFLGAGAAAPRRVRAAGAATLRFVPYAATGLPLFTGVRRA